MKKIILIDGNSLLYRAFYALPTTLTTSNGVITNAVYGFTSMLIKLIKNERPDSLAVAFDKGITTFRNEIYVDYKAHRDETPNELRHQFELIKEVLASLDIPIYEKAGFEADDILATAAKISEKAGLNVIVVTGDKDSFQLIDDNTRVMTTRKGISDIVIYDREKLFEKYGISPLQMPDMLGLKGDPSDNIPGIPGVGEKTAIKLVQQYGNMENIFDNLEDFKGKLKENLVEFKDQGTISKKLATLIFDVDVNFNIRDCVLRLDSSKAKDVFIQMQFNTLFERLKEIGGTSEPEEQFSPNIIENDIKTVITLIEKERSFSIDFVGDINEIKNIMLCFNEDVYSLEAKKLVEIIKFLKDPKYIKTAYNAKQLVFLLHFLNINLRNIDFDIQIASYLLEPTRANYSAEEIAFKYLNLYIEKQDDPIKSAALRCYLAQKLRSSLEKDLKENGLERVYLELELPLILILAKMEYRGVGLDIKILKTYSQELQSLISVLIDEIYSLAGEEFNISSPLQLSKILFENLKLKPTKKIKTGYSTDSGVLIKLINEHDIIEKIINYRELTKLKSTYVDALPKLINPKTHRLHTTFNQTVTATGRLSSTNPNLQNIPIRTELGKNIRRAFVSARKTDNLLVADYSQIELRVLAHLANDSTLISAFESHQDIHQTTAAEVFDLKMDEVNENSRRKAKAVNFGIVYGISAFGLAAQLQVSNEEAAEYIKLYFNRYPGVKSFIDSTIKEAYEKGFVSTIYGRKRWMPELKNNDIRIRNFGERSAVNSVIQGSAADIIKQAMINIEKKLKDNGLLTRMVLQVHDELIFEVPLLETNAATELIKYEMENAYKLKPPLEVHINIGKNWIEAK